MNNPGCGRRAEALRVFEPMMMTFETWRKLASVAPGSPRPGWRAVEPLRAWPDRSGWVAATPFAQSHA
jgi:hypothetical protein